jgi:hypothetical protein
MLLVLPEHSVLEGQAWAKLPIHRKSSIRDMKGEEAFAFNDLPMKSPFDLGNEIKGLNSGFKTTILLDCLPMGGLGSSCSSK